MGNDSALERVQLRADKWPEGRHGEEQHLACLPGCKQAASSFPSKIVHKSIFKITTAFHHHLSPPLAYLCSCKMEEPAPEDVCMESIEFSDNSDSPPDQTAPDTAECSVIDEALQYAYQHNLISDHLLSSFSLTSLFGKLIQTTFPPTNEDGFTDSTHLADLEVPDIILREHLSLTDSACRLISEAYHDPKDEDIEALTRRVYESVSISNQRLELPILRSDNDWDLREFKKEQLSRLYIPIKNHRLPLDTPDNEAGEGMALPASVREESDLFYEKIQGERIGVTKNALKFLADQLRADITKEDLISYLIGELKYKKVSR